MRAFDWSKTALGPPEQWPQALRLSVSTCLNSRFGIVLWWGRDLIMLYNDAYAPMPGNKHPAALGAPGRQVWPEIWNVIGPMLEGVMERGEATWADNLLLEIARDGYLEELYFTFSYSPIRDESGAVAGIFTPVQETTRQVIGERRLRTVSDLAEAARTSNAQDAETVCRITARVLADNPRDLPFAALYLLSGDDEAFLAGVTGLDSGCTLFPHSVHLADPSAWLFARGAAGRAPQVVSLPDSVPDLPCGPWSVPPRQAVVLPITPGGRRCGFMIAAVSPRKRLDEEYRSFLSLVAGHVTTAITEARALEQERRRAEALAEVDRAKTAFFSNVSHEFRTPLTLMLGPLESVLADGDLSSQDRETIATAHRNSLRLLKLVNSLLDFSRIEAGRVRASFQPVDLGQLTIDLASGFRSVMQAAGIGFDVDCPPLPEPVFVDAEMWEKIVLNLLSNAFKFTLSGRVTVTLRAAGRQVELAVADTGVGIPESELPRVFDRFHRVEGVTGRTWEGSGIGLALLHELVKLHGGTVRATSRPGEGSTFTVSIPLGTAHLPQDRIGPPADTHTATALRADAYTQEALSWLNREGGTVTVPDLAPQDSASPVLDRRPTVLVADDNADMRDHVARILAHQCDVICVADGREALKAVRDHRPDLILSDVMMPGLDGLALLRELRADPQLRDMPVILLSARAGEEARSEGLESGADDYLTKPFSARELATRVHSTLALQQVRLKARAGFETLLNQAPIGVYVVDAGLRIREVNPTARAVFGDIPDLIGRDLQEVMHILWPHYYADEVVRLFRHTLETGEPHVTPERARPRNDVGITEYYEWRIDRIPLADSHFGVVCYFRDISSQVHARNEIARSEERFRAFVTATSDAVYRMNADWTEMRHLHGGDFIADTQDPSRSWLHKYILPEDHSRVLSAIETAIRTGNTFELEHRVILADGSVGWTLSRAIPLRDPDGRIVEWFGTARDVTDHKRDQESLERISTESEQQRRLYDAVLSSTPDLAYVFDLGHRFTYANQALLNMWGKTAAEAIGKTCLELGYEPWHAEMHDREIEQVVATGKPVRGDVPFTGTQGRRFYDYILVPVFGPNGNVEAVAGTTRDVTERRNAEQQARDSEARLRFMAESMPQKIFTATPKGNVDSFNRQWLNFTGLTQDDIRGWDWMQSVHPEDAEETERAWHESVASGEPFQYVHRLRRAGGTWRWHLTRANAMRGLDGSVTMWIGSSTDIDEQKHTEDELRRANQALEQFAYTATHDLQEPLRGVKIYSELLQTRHAAKLDGQALECLNYLRMAATRMEMLVRDLLSYTQIGRLEASPEPADANAALRLALENLDGAVSEAGAKIHSGELPAVRVHATHLQQLFQNLIGNAVKYRHQERPPEVWVAAAPTGDTWTFSIRDNGIGIHPEYRERIFGLFKRLHSAGRYAGTGIGLAICHRIVQQYHGSIWVESEPGQGSEFRFTLPA